MENRRIEKAGAADEVLMTEIGEYKVRIEMAGAADEVLMAEIGEYCSPIYRISLANALPNAILSKFALIARNSEAFGSICKHSVKISNRCEN